jgi:carbon starvation protein CstA
MQITVNGIPIPSSAPLFLGVLAVHVVAGVVAVIAGAVAALSAKRPSRHPRAGTVYFWALSIAVGTMLLLALIRWSEDRVLVAIGGTALLSALVGRSAIRRSGSPVARHVIGMGTSYTLMLVAFYVDNGAHLPVWRDLPPVTYWVAPLTIGAAVIGLAVYRHRDTRAPVHSSFHRPRP